MNDFVKVSTAWSRQLRRSSLVVIMTIVLLLTACSAPRHLIRTTDLRDTVIRTEVVRDTVVVIESDQAMIRALLECDSIGQVHVTEILEYRNGQRMHPPSLKVANNILTVTAKCDSIAIYLQLKDRYERHITTYEQSAVQTIEVNRLNGWQKWWMRTGQVLAFALILFGVFKTRKLLKI